MLVFLLVVIGWHMLVVWLWVQFVRENRSLNGAIFFKHFCPWLWWLFFRRSSVFERVTANSLKFAVSWGVPPCPIPRVFVTRGWVPAGRELGVYFRGDIFVSSARIVSEGLDELRFTLAHELGHHLDNHGARPYFSELAVLGDSTDDREIVADIVGCWILLFRNSN